MSKHSILVGMIGSSIQASLAPTLHMAEGAALGLNYLYRLIDLNRLGVGTDALPALLTAAEQMGFDGLVITHPCKQLVMGWLDETSPAAKAMGAVNVVVLQDGRRLGHNTDWIGFRNSFLRDMGDLPRGTVTVIGAGGAGAAVAYALLSVGANRLLIVDLNADLAARLAQSLSAQFDNARIEITTDLAGALLQSHGAVNATPVGMAEHPGTPIPLDQLRPDLWIIDVIYFPAETRLLGAARRISARASNGAAMSALQVAEQIRLFSNIDADSERVLAHVNQLMGTAENRLPLNESSVA